MALTRTIYVAPGQTALQKLILLDGCFFSSFLGHSAPFPKHHCLLCKLIHALKSMHPLHTLEEAGPVIMPILAAAIVKMPQTSIAVSIQLP